MQITEQIIERIARRTFNSMFVPALRQSNVVIGGGGSSVSWADNAGHANSADTAASASAAPWTGITGKPATATRWPSWSEVTEKPNVAIQAAHNNLLAAGNEFTFASSGFSGGIWLNYRTAGGLNGAITGYTLGDGAGHALGTIIHSGNISSQSVNYANSAGSATKATQDGDGNTISSTYLKLAGGTITGNIIPNTDNAIDLGSSTKRWRYIYTYGVWGKSETALRLGGNDATLMYLTANNRCGIGTDSPGAKIGVAGGADMWAGYFNGNSQSAVFLAHSGGNGAYICSKKNDTTYLFALYKNQTSLGSNGDVVMYARCDGNVGFGTTSPSQKLHVSGGLAAITNNSRTVTIGAQNNGAIHIYNDNSSPFFFNGDVRSNASKTYDLGSSTYPWGKLYAAGCNIYDTSPSVHVGTSSSARISLHWSGDSNRGLYDYTGNWVVATNGTNTFMMKGNVGIGTTSPGDDKLKVVGSICTTVGLYSEGYVDGLAYNTASDKRLKDIIDYDAVPHIDDIANAPAIHFTWKNKRDKKIHVGTIAQYWQKITPECVHQSKRRFLTMNYDVIALVNTIALAREINALKREIAELKNKAQ